MVDLLAVIRRLVGTAIRKALAMGAGCAIVKRTGKRISTRTPRHATVVLHVPLRALVNNSAFQPGEGSIDLSHGITVLHNGKRRVLYLFLRQPRFRGIVKLMRPLQKLIDLCGVIAFLALAHAGDGKITVLLGLVLCLRHRASS